MSLTVSDLLKAKDAAAWRADFLAELQGIGFVTKTGLGSGGLKGSGVAAGAYSVQVKVVTAGELGTAQFQYSLDAGSTWSATTNVPSSGSYALSTTGCTLLFSAGPAGGGTSFVVGDLYTLQLSLPTLPVTAWQPGSTPLTLVECDAEGMGELSAAVQTAISGGFLRESGGDWLTLLAFNFYDLARAPGVVARRTLTLTDTAGGGPFTIVAGAFWVSTAGGLRFVAETGGTLGAGGTLPLTFRAESPGQRYNVGAGVINTLVTVLAGVAVSDPVTGGVATPAFLTYGQDAESDAALVTRCLNRWPALGVGVPNASYDLWAKAASANVTRTKVRADVSVPGQVDLFIAGAAGALGSGDITAVQAYIDLRTRETFLTVVSSVTNHAINVTAQVYCYTGYGAAVTKAITDALTALISGVPMEGTVYLSEIIQALADPVGERNVVVTVPGADVVLSTGEVATPGSFALTVTEVSPPSP